MWALLAKEMHGPIGSHSQIPGVFQDGNHVMMFRKNAGSYLHELMRLDAAVQQFTTALEEEETMMLEGHKAIMFLNHTWATPFLSLGIIAM